MLKVLFAASEAFPFVKTGGLGDVVGSLPKELRSQGIDARVMIPKYGTIGEKYRDVMKFCKKLQVSLGWRRQYCGVEYLEHDGVPFYFIDNEYYFKRLGVYGYYDEAERYTFFCRAVLDVLPHIDFQPNIIHCHDWHTGMVGAFLQSQYQRWPFYRNILTLFTIHNLKYQGVFDKHIVDELLGLGWEYFTAHGVEFYDKVNFMKSGLIFADAISTVSRSYAQEIQYPFFGEGLDGVLRQQAGNLHGIINGIDYEVYNPATDRDIFRFYDGTTLDRKLENKLALQAALDLPQRGDIPIIGVISRLVPNKGIDLIIHVLKEILAMDVQVIILGTGEWNYEQLLRQTAAQFPDKLSANILFDDALAHRIYAASDLFLMPSLFEPCGIGQLIAMRYGSLPIVRETGGLNDTVTSYNEGSGEGNGFSFTNYNAHDLLYTIRRALGFYSTANWSHIVKQAMEAEFSWRHSAGEYVELYNKMLIEHTMEAPACTRRKKNSKPILQKN